MNSTLATEAAEKTTTRSLLETWGKNERMRHIPTAEWIVSKLDRDLRRRIGVLAAAPMNDALESELKTLCRAIDRLADAAKQSRGAVQPPQEIASRIDFAITHAVSCLNSLDANLFGRRYPFQTFERSKAESVYGALLVVIDRVHRVTELVRTLDRGIDEKLLEQVA
ncbi:MAG TPA: hypothetical protein VJ853_04230 [Thermoanaerobaculia bacterium]|nr:hypothetical protein [Thermoanaerobaculia bacterium]